jgi:hypothetical protein
MAYQWAMRATLFLSRFALLVLGLVTVATVWGSAMYHSHPEHVALHKEWTYALPIGRSPLLVLVVLGGGALAMLAFSWACKMPWWTLSAALTLSGGLANYLAMTRLGGVPDFLHYGAYLLSPGDLFVMLSWLALMVGAARLDKPKPAPRRRARRRLVASRSW